jgi:hypothetical protein
MSVQYYGYSRMPTNLYEPFTSEDLIQAKQRKTFFVRDKLGTASGTRYQGACTTRMTVFWPGNFCLENYDVS